MPRVLSILTGSEVERPDAARPPARQPARVDAILQLLGELRGAFDAKEVIGESHARAEAAFADSARYRDEAARHRAALSEERSARAGDSERFRSELWAHANAAEIARREAVGAIEAAARHREEANASKLEALRLNAELAKAQEAATASSAEIQRLNEKLAAVPPPAPARPANAPPPKYLMQVVERSYSGRLARITLQPENPNTGFPSYSMEIAARDGNNRPTQIRMRPVESNSQSPERG